MGHFVSKDLHAFYVEFWQQEQRRRSGVLRRHRVQRHERVLRLLLQRRQSLNKPKYLK